MVIELNRHSIIYFSLKEKDLFFSFLSLSSELEFAASLLQVPSFLLQKELTFRQFQGSANRSTSYEIPLTPTQV
jgi:hypothetical protein